MFRVFDHNRLDLFRVTYKFVNERIVHRMTATSAGLASLESDYCIEIIDTEKI